MTAAASPGAVRQSERRAPSADAPLGQWLAWLEAGRGEHIELGLERCQVVAGRLGITRPARQVITVAGTNGKGSSVALLETVWRLAGHRVGTYTSPHLTRYNERIRIGAQPVDDATVCAAFAAVEDARGDVPLTYFEFGTLAALRILGAAVLDVAVLEVGLGGRLDAVNIIDSDVALITAIGLDHEDWLGSTREAIGLEKAGIMRHGRPVVCSDHDVPSTVVAHARELGAPLSLLGAEYAFEAAADSWTWWCGGRVLEALPRPALVGAHQLRNAAGVLAVIDLLDHDMPVDDAALRAGLAAVELRGRFQRVAGRGETVMDVAHNPLGAEIFAASLRTLPPAAPAHAVVGMLKTKNHREFLRPLLPLVDAWYFADLPGPQGARAEDLRRALLALEPRATVTCHESVEAALDAAEAVIGPVAAAGGHAQRDSGADGRIIVTGSFITVGAAIARRESGTA